MNKNSQTLGWVVVNFDNNTMRGIQGWTGIGNSIPLAFASREDAEKVRKWQNNQHHLETHPWPLPAEVLARLQAPAKREWLLRMADLEDSCGSVAAGVLHLKQDKPALDKQMTYSLLNLNSLQIIRELVNTSIEAALECEKLENAVHIAQTILQPKYKDCDTTIHRLKIENKEFHQATLYEIPDLVVVVPDYNHENGKYLYEKGIVVFPNNTQTYEWVRKYSTKLYKFAKEKANSREKREIISLKDEIKHLKSQLDKIKKILEDK